MLNNWSNPVHDGTLADACNERTRQYAAGDSPGYVSLIGMEVEFVGQEGRHRRGDRKVLLPCYNSVGFPPHVGEEIECSALGLGTRWRVVAVAQGYPGAFEIRG